jgi:hypothetical protein
MPVDPRPAPRRRRPLPLALLACLAIAARPLAADCTDNASNLLRNKNCDLTDGVDGWTKEPGHFDILHVPDDGTPEETGAGEQVSTDVDLSSNFIFVSQQTSRCAEIVLGGAYSWGAWRRFEGSPPVADCRVLLRIYSGYGCTGSSSALNGGVSCPFANAWTSCSASVPAGILVNHRSVRLTLVCSLDGPSVQPFVVRFDDAFVTGPDPTILESDWEDGTFGDWTVVNG